MAVNDLYRLHFFINCSEQVTQCVLGYRMDFGSMDADTLEALCQAFIDDAQPKLLLLLSENALVSRVQVTTVTNHQEVPGLVDQVSQFGNIVSQTLPPNMAAIIHLPTNAPNAKHNGRIFLAGIPEQGQDAGTLTGAQITLNQAFADELAIDLEPTAPQDAIFTPVVISTVLNGAPRIPPVGFPVLLPVAKSLVRQQRRRKTVHFGFGS